MYIYPFLIILQSLFAPSGPTLANSTRRIRFGEIAAENEFPFFALVQIVIIKTHKDKKDTFLYSYCGASIIGKNWLVSAGHCFFGHSLYAIDVYVGSNKYRNGTRYGVNSSVHIHPEFRGLADKGVAHIYNNIAVLETVNYFRYSDHIKPIKLMDKEVVPFDQVRQMGFGTDKDPLKPGFFFSATNELRSTLKIVIGKETCKYLLKGLIDVHDHQSCSIPFDNMKGTACYGDSGGPVVFKPEGAAEWSLAGIISQSNDCDTQPDVFVVIPDFINFIQGITGPL